MPTATLVNTKRLLTLAAAKPQIKEVLGQALASRVLAATKQQLSTLKGSATRMGTQLMLTTSAPS